MCGDRMLLIVFKIKEIVPCINCHGSISYLAIFLIVYNTEC